MKASVIHLIFGYFTAHFLAGTYFVFIWKKKFPGAFQFVKPYNENIKNTLQMARDMIQLADKGDFDRKDSGCGILYGILRDSAYKLLKLAEVEMQAHIKKGWWK